MDPNAALAMMRVQALVAEREGSPPARALAETVRALDGWLSRGGFPPEAWREGPDAAGEAPARVEDVPADWPVQPIRPVPGDPEVTTCGHCGLSWDDAIVTSMTPAPSARCPFEPFHVY